MLSSVRDKNFLICTQYKRIHPVVGMWCTSNNVVLHERELSKGGENSNESYCTSAKLALVSRHMTIEEAMRGNT